MFCCDVWNGSLLATTLYICESRFVVIQMLMSVLWITEAAVHTQTAPTHLEPVIVPALEDITATDLTVQVDVQLQRNPQSKITQTTLWTSVVVSGTTVRALVPGRFGRKNTNNKFERYVQRTNKNISNYIAGLVLWAADVCFRAAFAQLGPVSSISLGRFFRW